MSFKIKLIVFQIIAFSCIANAETFKGKIQNLIPDDEGLKVIVNLSADSHSKEEHTDLFYLENLNKQYEKILNHLESCHKKHENVELILEKKIGTDILSIKDIK